MSVWTLKTASVAATIEATEAAPLWKDLTTAGDDWNWMPEAYPVPLPEVWYVDGEACRPDWKWDGEAVEEDTHRGHVLTLRYTDESLGAGVRCAFTAPQGEGPIVQAITLENRSGREWTVMYKDMVSAEWQVKASDEVHLYNFTRSKLFGFSRFPGEPLADTGVIEHWFQVNNCFNHNICNEYANQIPTNYPMLPFEVYRTLSGRGLYFAHEYAFGRFQDSCERDPLQLTHKTYLWDAGRLTVPAGEELKMPPAYIGGFVGDLDTAGNQIKNWFWDYLPKNMRQDENEPITHVCVPAEEKNLKAFLAKFPLKDMGFELGKIDIAWLDGTMPLMENWPDSDMDRITHWEPHPDKWPDGMTGGKLLAEAGLRFSLWMSDTYKKVNIGTKEGREIEKRELFKRSMEYGFDTWRSDFELENDPFDYRTHEGLLEILDYMIENRPGFRYEHCSGAAALKDYSTLQRISVYTTEDGATAIRHRKAFYTNSYAIPPVQIKADIAYICHEPAEDIIGETNPLFNAQYARYILRSGFLGAHQDGVMMAMFNQLGPLHQWRYEQTPVFQERQRHLDLYKGRMRPILRRGDVYHVLPIADNVNWDGFFFYNRYIDKGALIVFKPALEAKDGDNKCIALKGLEPDGLYECEFEDRKEQSGTYTGKQLMEEGLWVKGLSGIHASEIVWVTKKGV